MNETNTKKLIQDFPRLYREHPAPDTAFARYGFQVDDGWFELLYELSADLEHLIETENTPVTVLQVKEKLAELRFYLSSSRTDAMRARIKQATEASIGICELCGAPGQTWIADYTRCVRCDICKARAVRDDATKGGKRRWLTEDEWGTLRDNERCVFGPNDHSNR